ncbi:MAG: GlsB/YeaQ/YmgE family stress response membrane protein [Propionibacteriaceae bacterium]
MSIIAFLLVGLIAGGIARKLMPNPPLNGGWLKSLGLGIIGSMLGGWLGSHLLGWYSASFFSLRTWILAIGGSLLTLFLYGYFRSNKRTR